MSAVLVPFLVIVAAFSLRADRYIEQPEPMGADAVAGTTYVSAWSGRNAGRNDPWLVIVSFASGAALVGAGTMHRLRAAGARKSPADSATGDTSSEWRILTANEDEVLTEHDARGVIRHASASLANLTGHPMRALIGRKGEDLVHEDDLPQLRAAVYAARNHGPGTSALFRMKTSTGAYVWLDGRFHSAEMQTREPRLKFVARPVALSV